MPWYAAHRDLLDPGFCRLDFYGGLAELERHRGAVAQADAVIVGSYVPDGVAVGRWAQAAARGVTAFYDIDTPVTLAKLERGDFEYLSPGSHPGLRRLPVLHRRPDPGASQGAATAPRPPRRSTAPSIRRPTRGWSGRNAGISAISAPTAPTGSRPSNVSSSSPPGARRTSASSSPGRNIPPASLGRTTSSASSTSRRDEHPAFYAASRFTLNVTRGDMIRAGYSPSVRLFEAAACGTPIVSDVWDGIETILAPGREIVLAREPEDILACCSAGRQAGRRTSPRQRAGAFWPPIRRRTAHASSSMS